MAPKFDAHIALACRAAANELLHCQARNLASVPRLPPVALVPSFSVSFPFAAISSWCALAHLHSQSPTESVHARGKRLLCSFRCISQIWTVFSNK